MDLFDKLEFMIIRDGPLIDEHIKPIKHFTHVKYQKNFLQHHQIAKIHKNYGIFLIPTRMDSQGVSRDEAMASGLVPITNNVAAIPEFVDSECGILVEPENAKLLADAIEFLYKNPEEFMRLSRNDANRVRMQCDKDWIISKELDIIL